MRDHALVCAIDAPDPAAALQLAMRIGPAVDGIKLGLPPLLNAGVSLIQRIKQRVRKPVLADLKVADIGFRGSRESDRGPAWSGTNARIVETAVRAGADYVICHTLGGTAGIEECVEVAHASGGQVLTLPYMTQEGASVFFDQPIDLVATSAWMQARGHAAVAESLRALHKRKPGHKVWRFPTVTISDLILLLGEYYHVDGYVGPANQPEVLRDYRRLTDKFIFATGVGRQGGRMEDVYRILGARSGAIVGHAITTAPDPRRAAQGLAARRDRVTRQRL